MVIYGYTLHVEGDLTPERISAPEYAYNGDPPLLAAYCLEDESFAEKLSAGEYRSP